MITYKGYRIYKFDDWRYYWFDEFDNRYGPFDHYSEAEASIDKETTPLESKSV